MGATILETPGVRCTLLSQEGAMISESHLICCCLIDEGATLDRAISAGLSGADFSDTKLATTFEELRTLRQKNKPITVTGLVEQLGPRLKMFGSIETVMALSDSAQVGHTTTHAGHHLKEVIKASISRRLASGAEIGEIKYLLDAILTQGAPKEDPATRRIRSAQQPPEPTTRLFLAGKPIATPGNLVTLISKAKTGKTAAIGAVVAAIVAAHHDRKDMDTLKFTAPHTKEAVVLIDTEQSLFDAYTCHQRAMSRAGQQDDPDWLHHFALVGYGWKQLREALPPILDRASAAHSGIFTLILDGVADFVPSVNDEIGCSEFISWLRALSVKHSCPVICVIHSNEGVKTGDDGRGWLGKELARKAESNLLLKKVGEVTAITSDKQRKAPITIADGVAFAWSSEAGRHVSCQATSDNKRAGRPKTHTFHEFIQIFPKSDQRPMSRNALFRFATEISTIKETSFRELLHQAVQDGELVRSQDGAGFGYKLAF